MALVTPDAEAPRHLLVRLPNPLGDAVLATPALRALRTAHPSARITWMGRRAPLAAVDGLPERDGVVPAPPRGERSVRMARWTRRAWRRAGIDTVLLLPHSWSAALAARWSGVPRRIGSDLHGRSFLLTTAVSLPEQDGALRPRSMVRMYLDLAAPLGAVDDGAGPKVVATAYDRRRAEQRLDGIDGPLLAINPGAAYGPSKVYPPEHLAEVARRVGVASGLRPIVLCGPGEEALAADVARRLGGDGLSTHDDPPDVGELKALLGTAAVVLTTDTGPRHLAEALGTPTVVVMGPTDPRWTEESRATLVRREGLACLGCHHRHCPIEHPCMRDLAPQRVADAVLAAFGTPTAGG